MNPNDLKIAVIGAGAIGGVTAALMTKAGWEPILVCKHADTLAQVTSPGIVVTRLGETLTVPVRGVLTIADLPRDLDIVFHATKANDCVAVARELLPYLHDESIVVSMQNGISEDALAGVLGRERVAGCVENLAVTLKGPGEIDVTREGEFILGHIDHKQDERIKLIQPMLDAVEPTRISDNIMGELFSKLMFNACINTLAAINGVALGKLLAVRKVRSIFIALMQETLSVANAMGIRLAPPPRQVGLLQASRGAQSATAVQAPPHRAYRRNQISPYPSLQSPVPGAGPPHGDRLFERLYLRPGRRACHSRAGQPGGRDHGQGDRGG